MSPLPTAADLDTSALAEVAAGLEAGDLKGCCAAVYEQPAVRWLLGGELHPGGEDLIPLPRLVDVDDYLEYVSNRAVPDLDVKRALEGLWSAKAAGGTGPTADRLDCVACAVGLPVELQEVATRGFMIAVQDFQDPYTLDVGKLKKCCVSEITPDGRMIPFCAYNSVGYREQVRELRSGRVPA